MKTPFKIDHIDPMGQGVSRVGDKVTFIPKTLPEESGQAIITREARGVRFARIDSPSDIQTKSELRIEASCPHFDQCNGCHYLHTDYKNEIGFKKDALYRHLMAFDRDAKENIDIKVFAAPKRDGYRNRLQLHYDKKRKLIGLINSATKSIVRVPECQIAARPIREKLQKLYQNDSWMKEVSKGAPRGHIELYMKNGEVKVSANRPYAEGGFTQVFSQMNDELVTYLEGFLSESERSPLLVDLFGGNGNLTKNQIEREVLVVDYSQRDQKSFPKHQSYQQLDLYKDSALATLDSKLNERDNQLILDPPRKGYPGLKNYVDKYSPKEILYISCQASTMTRDIRSIADKYKIKEVALFDFFPSTHHFESFCILEQKLN